MPPCHWFAAASLLELSTVKQQPFVSIVAAALKDSPPLLPTSNVLGDTIVMDIAMLLSPPTSSIATPS